MPGVPVLGWPDPSTCAHRTGRCPWPQPQGTRRRSCGCATSWWHCWQRWRCLRRAWSSPTRPWRSASPWVSHPLAAPGLRLRGLRAGAAGGRWLSVAVGPGAAGRLSCGPGRLGGQHKARSARGLWKCHAGCGWTSITRSAAPSLLTTRWACIPDTPEPARRGHPVSFCTLSPPVLPSPLPATPAVLQPADSQSRFQKAIPSGLASLCPPYTAPGRLSPQDSEPKRAGHTVGPQQGVPRPASWRQQGLGTP